MAAEDADEADATATESESVSSPVDNQMYDRLLGGSEAFDAEPEAPVVSETKANVWPWWVWPVGILTVGVLFLIVRFICSYFVCFLILMVLYVLVVVT